MNTEQKAKRSNLNPSRYIMNLHEMVTAANNAFIALPWIAGIQSRDQYDELMELADELVEDYEKNHTLIELLLPVIHKYEEEADEFKEFKKDIDAIDPAIAMLRVIIDQHQLTYSDFKNEIGGKSLVSMILNGERSLTLSHIKALSLRFGIDKAMFI